MELNRNSNLTGLPSPAPVTVCMSKTTTHRHRWLSTDIAVVGTAPETNNELWLLCYCASRITYSSKLGLNYLR